MTLTGSEACAKFAICHPLDNLKTRDEIYERVKQLGEYVGVFKIGKGAYTRFGPELIVNVGAHVFLDLKYHDIPNTVKDAAEAAAELGVYMFNVHCAGGLEMMKAAMEGARDGALRNRTRTRPYVVGVTLLTSLGEKDLDSVCIKGSVNEVVYRRAKLAEEAGLDGVVCSAADLAGGLKQKFRKGFKFITPGISGLTTDAGKDQKRVADPVTAIQNGSSMLVIGRAISEAKDMNGEAYKILKAIEKYF